MSHYKRWSTQDKTELKTLKTKGEVKKYAKDKGRTISAVCNAIRRYTDNVVPQSSSIKPVTRQTSTLVFHNYKSIIVENNSILIEF